MKTVAAAFAFLTLVVTAGSVGAQEVREPGEVICIDWCPIVRPGSPVVVESYIAETTIDNQVAVTRVTQILRNDRDHGVAEGYLYLPLPAGASVTDLVLWIDGEPVSGDLLDADEARGVYREIVSTLNDPALLEWVDHQLLQLSVFPIPPGGTRKVEIEYIELLAADGGLVSYRHPFGAELARDARIEHLAISVTVTSNAALRAVYSPSHRISVDRPDDHHFVTSFESSHVSEREDFSLFYSTSDADIAANLFSFREGSEDGYFLLLVAPGVEVSADQVIAKDVVLVLDRSGSMEGEKFDQAVQAARFVVGHLNEDDRFNIITFSRDLDMFARRLRPAAEASEAERWLNKQSAEGSTDINRALLEAVEMFDGERPGYVIFLTDGLPTHGEKDPGGIIANLADSAPEDLALFAFGVGFDVDTVLLDTLADDHHGTTSYVAPGDRIDETISGFYAKVTTPVLTGVDIDVDGPALFDLHPNQPGDVFAGEQLAIVGRYRGVGSATVRISGNVNGRPVVFTYRDIKFREAGGSDFLPRLWATRKIGSLLREIQIYGPNQELVEQIVSISVGYGIVTPYTSFLVTEPVPLTTEDVREMAQFQLRSGAFDLERSGEAAVTYAGSAQALRDAPASSPVEGDASASVRVTGNRAFTLIDGVWVDTAFDPVDGLPLPVAYLSEDYFALASARRDVAAALAVGERVIVVVDEVAYEIVQSDADADPIDLPAAFIEPATVGGTPSVVVDVAPTRAPLAPDRQPIATSPVAGPEKTAAVGGTASPVGKEPDPSSWPLLLAAGSLLAIAIWWIRRRRPGENPQQPEPAEPERADIRL